MSPTNKVTTPEPTATDDVEFSVEARSAFEEFGAYSNSRSIPDVRDGMKTGGRRTLWAVHRANAVPGKSTRKAALLVGQVMAYHPHGDAGIYDGMVTMTHVPSDGPSIRKLVPLIYGQGGWGDVDHGAAASRYTEARLNEEAMLMLGLSEDVLGKSEAAEVTENGVRMVKNYSGELDEPTVLPALWPQFVINGAEGIGAGVSTFTPGHHPAEALDLALALVDTDNPRWSTIQKLMPGPDLPADCDIYDIDGGIENYMTTGKGQFMMRARYEIVPSQGRGKKSHTLVVTGLPFRISPTMVVEGINDLIASEELPPLRMRNLTDGNGIRLEIDLGSGDPDAIVQRLLYFGRKTRLQEAFSVNSWAIVDNQVRRVSTIDALREWVAHRRTVIRRRTKFRLDKAEERHEVVIGLLKAVPIAHLIVEVVRNSANRADAAVEMTKQWGFTERQNQAILDMNVGQLSKLGVERYEAEKDFLEARIADCKKILAEPKTLSARLKDEIRATKKHFADVPRRTRLFEGSAKVERPKSAAVVVPAKKVYLAHTSTWYLRQVAKRNINPIVGVDHVTGFIETTNHDFVDVVTNRGGLTRIKASAVPDKATRADALVDVAVGEKSVLAMSTPGGADVVMVTRSGFVKRAGAEDNSKMRVGRTYNVLPLSDGDEVGWAFHAVPGKDERFVAITAKGYVLAVDADDQVLRPKSRTARGNPLINITKDDSLVWVGLVGAKDRVVAWTEHGGTFTFKSAQVETLNRGVKGKLVCHHKSPVVGATSGAGKVLRLFHPEMDEARAVDVKTITAGIDIKRPVAVEGIAQNGTVVWLGDENSDTEPDDE
jgi:DNA gyrase subunit A